MRETLHAAAVVALLPAALGSAAQMAGAKPGDIFQLVRELETSAPLTRAKVEAFLGTKLAIVDENAHFLFLSGEGPSLPDGTKVRSVDLRVAKTNPAHQGFVVLAISGRCVTLPD